MIIKTIRLVFSLIFFSTCLFAQNIFIKNITKNDFSELKSTVGPQNWDLAQDTLGRIWVANTSAVLLFDGVNWSAVKGTEYKDIRNFVVSNDNIIYAGGENDIGYFTQNERGQTMFASIMHLLEEGNEKIGAVHSVATHNGAVFFKTRD